MFPDVIIHYPSPTLSITRDKQILIANIKQEPPALAGEYYPVTISLSQAKSYQLRNIQIQLNEVNSNNNNTPCDIFTNSGGEYQKLINNQLEVDKLGDEESVIELYVQFKEKGEKYFTLTFKYTGNKLLAEKSKSPEFKLENNYNFSVNIKTPFTFASEWITDEACISCEEIKKPKNLTVGEKALISTRIMSMSEHKVEINSLKLKNIEGLMKDYTKLRAVCKPVVLSKDESLSNTFCVQALKDFPVNQVACLEFSWSRLNNPMKSIYLIDLPRVGANLSNIQLFVTYKPEKPRIFQELFITYKFKNVTDNVLEVKVQTEESQDFVLNGSMAAKLIVPPHELDELKYVVHPLKSGKVNLPSVSTSIFNMEGIQLTEAQHMYESSIYIFPS